MNVTTATDFITANKGSDIAIVLTDGTEISGSALSVNSKGVNVKIDGKTKSVSLARIDSIDLDNADDTYGADDTADDVAAADDAEMDLHDGMTTRELADLLGTTPKELRVTLRALGLGVGKGRSYALTVDTFRWVKAHLTVL